MSLIIDMKVAGALLFSSGVNLISSITAVALTPLFSSGAGAADPPDDAAKLSVCSSTGVTAVDIAGTVTPSIGQEREAETGSLLFTSDAVTIGQEGIELEREASFSDRYAGADFVVTLPPVKLVTSDIRNGTYSVPHASFRYLREGKERHGFSRPDIGLLMDRSGTVLHANVSFGLKAKDYVVPGAVIKQLRCVNPSPDANALRKEILYGGVAKGVLTLQYREFMGGTARPAFSQDATFDLSAGNEIGFKGVRLKILSTSNMGVRYVITGLRAE